MPLTSAPGPDDLPVLPGVRHRHVVVRGCRLHLAEAGDDDAPPVVLLHGFPQHWYAWRDIIGALAVRQHVIAVDLPGFGWSEPSGHGYSTAERARTVTELLDVLGICSADLIGHDWGGWLAFRVALDAPERVQKLVCVSEIHPWPVQRRLIPNLWRMWVTALFEVPLLGSYVQRHRGILAWFLGRDALDPAIWTESLVDVYAARAALPSTARAGRRMHSSFVLRDIARLVVRRDRSRRFSTPTLLISGSCDRYIPPTLMAPPVSRSRVLRHEIIDGGHFLLDENPQQVMAAVRRHLASDGQGSIEDREQRP